MLLGKKTAVVYGGGGAIGGAVARTFAREGARVFVAGRTRRKLDRVVADIVAAGGTASAHEVDVLDAASVERCTDAIAVAAGGAIDIAFNATGFVHVQGQPLAALSLDSFEHPVHTYIRSNFLTAKAAARHMAARGKGVILMVTTPVSQMTGPGFMGHCVALAGVEAMTRHLAGELGASGVRVACIRSHAIADAIAPELESSSREVFAPMLEPGTTFEQMLEGAAQGTLLRRLPRLDDVAAAAAFLASDRAGATTGAIFNMTGGMLLDS